MFANGPGDQGWIPGHVIPKTKKMVLDAALLNTHHYEVWIKGKWSNPGKGVAPFPTPPCSSYWKGSLRVTLDYGHQLYLLFYIALLSWGIKPEIWRTQWDLNSLVIVCQSSLPLQQASHPVTSSKNTGFVLNKKKEEKLMSWYETPSENWTL